MSFDDDDRPRRRGWETTRELQRADPLWTTPSPHTYTKVDTVALPQSAPLAEVHLPLPQAEAPKLGPELHELSVHLVMSDGLLLSDVELIATNSAGDETRFATDAVGLARVKLPEDTYQVRFAQTPLALPPVSAWSKDGGWGLRVLRDCQGFSVATGSGRDVVVIRPAVTEVVLDGWAQGSCVMRWGGMRPRVDGTVGTARAALRLALWLGRGKMMTVAGHADPLGQDTDNDALTAERAKSVQLFAAGKLEDWAEHAASHASELDTACALVACDRILHADLVDLSDMSRADTVLNMIRVNAGISMREGKPDVSDWLAIAELYAKDLASILLTDRAGLAELQSTISWTTEPTLALGERFPLPQSELVDLAGPLAVALRRCSLLIFGPDDTAQAAVDAGGHELYDGTYYRTVVPVPGEALVDIAVATPQRSSISRGRAWVNVGSLGAREHVAEEDGHIRFTTLRGDRIEVVAAFDAEGRGTMVSGGVG